LEAVHDPSVSNCVAAGSRYTPRPAFSCTPSTGIAAIAAVADGYGSMTIIMSSIFIALTISRPRVCEFGAWPQYTIARMFESWSMFSFFSITPSIQRETVMPGLPIIPGRSGLAAI